MNAQAILHIPQSNYCFADKEGGITLRLRAAAGELSRVGVVYGNKYDWTTARREAVLTKKFCDGAFDWYSVRLTPEDTRLAYIFELECGEQKRYYSENGVTEEYDFELGFYNFFQFPYLNAADVTVTPDWLKRASVYEIFPERFRIGDKSKDCSYVTMGWGDTPRPDSFAGGDLDGVTEKLDYLKELGFDCIYLTPIFESVSNHKYDIIDYYKVDERFGGNEALRRLVARAHGMGIRVVLDAVFNHCSERFAYFQDAERRGRASPYFDFFLVRGDRIEREPANYACFAACEYMPRFNTSNPAVRKYLTDVAVYWIREYGIDGWRLDVADEVSHVFWREFRTAVKAADPNAVMIGENWHDAYPYLMGDQYDSIMNYAFTKACLDYFAFSAFNAGGFAARLSAILMRNTDEVNRSMLNLLDSHDTFRFLTQTGGNRARLRCALAVLYCFTGVPCVYYGTEAALEGGYDPDCRRCFPWDAPEDETAALIRSLNRLRKSPALTEGEIALSAENGMFLLRRTRGAQNATLYVNLTGSARRAKIAGRDLLTGRAVDCPEIDNDGFMIIG